MNKQTIATIKRALAVLLLFVGLIGGLGLVWDPSGALAESEQLSTHSIQLGDVVNGTIYFDEFDEWCGTDTWRFTMPQSGYAVIDMSLQPVNGVGYACLEGAGFSECAPTSYTPGNYPENTLIFRNLYPGEYTIRVIGEWSESARHVCFNYEMALSSPLLLSATDSGKVVDIAFTPGDILAWSKLNNGEERWRMFFDASDVGVKGNVINIAAEGGSGDRLLLTLNTKQALSGVGPVSPQDIVVFDPSQLGVDTQGEFSMGFSGRDHELTGRNEKLDGIDGWVYGYEADPIGRGCFGFLLSTLGTAKVTSWTGPMQQANDDVFCKVYDGANGRWGPYDYFFDVNNGAANNGPTTEPAPGLVPGLAQEDVTALAYNDAADTMYLTIKGGGTIWGNRVNQRDIFAINYPDYLWGGVVWHGPDHGWKYRIDAIEWNGP